MRPGVLLDRDGVLNRAVVREGRGVSPRLFAEFELLPGVSAAVTALRDAGLPVVVVTNQPDIARGLLAPAELERMHQHLRARVPLEHIYTCVHDEADRCDCRKPRPGMLLRAAAEFQLDLVSSWMVGDSWKDVEAAGAVGCRMIFVTGAHSDAGTSRPQCVAVSLPDAVEIILNEVRRK
ncbi:MAG: HAD family hydrolase [Acidobacteria bacterium]|nr:HAD family hydrolase [Acidobacteriota bacterium]MCL5286661.1 HAD family hydrolase [Acidobacteriota bacterium]